MVTIQTNNLYHHHSSLYLFPFIFFLCPSLVFRPSPLISFLHFRHYFIYFLNCWNVEKLKKKVLPSIKKRNITTKPVVSVWFIHFFSYFYHLVRLTISSCIYIYIYIYLTLYCLDLSSNTIRRNPSGVIDKVQDFDIVVDKVQDFDIGVELQLCYYVHIQTNALKKVWTPPLSL